MLTVLRLAPERDLVRVVADQNGSPTYEPDLASAILAANRRLTVTPGDTRLYGIFQVAKAGATIWAGFAEWIFRRFAASVGPSAHVEPVTTVDSRRRPIHNS